MAQAAIGSRVVLAEQAAPRLGFLLMTAVGGGEETLGGTNIAQAEA